MAFVDFDAHGETPGGGPQRSNPNNVPPLNNHSSNHQQTSILLSLFRDYDLIQYIPNIARQGITVDVLLLININDISPPNVQRFKFAYPLHFFPGPQPPIHAPSHKQTLLCFIFWQGGRGVRIKTKALNKRITSETFLSKLGSREYPSSPTRRSTSSIITRSIWQQQPKATIQYTRRAGV